MIHFPLAGATNTAGDIAECAEFAEFKANCDDVSGGFASVLRALSEKAHREAANATDVGARP